MKALLIIFILLVQSAFAQNKIRPVVEIGYSKLISAGYYSRSITAGIGVKVNEHYYFQVNYFQEKSNLENSYQKAGFYRNQTIYLSTSYKLLDNNSTVSTSFLLGIGTEIASNARGEIVETGLRIKDKYSGSISERLYNKGRFFGKIKLQADIKLSDFNLLIGGGYTYSIIDIDYLNPVYIGYDLIGYSIDKDRAGIKSIFGLNLDISLRYTLNFGKKDKNIH